MRCALTALHSGGSTAGGQGLKLAYDLAKQNFDSKAVNRVILVTDGDFNVGVAEPARLKDFVADQRKSGVYLSVYGFGRGNYNDTMMQALAQNGNGVAAYVDSLNEARKLLRDDFDSASCSPSPTT
jgi:Ca-activated chloride channel family protein